MNILFCSNPLNSNDVDYDYKKEYDTAKDSGFNVNLINFDELINDNVMYAVKRIQVSPTPTQAIYRGWMMKPDIYCKLYEVLKQKNIILINSPKQYKLCHYLPRSYEIIKPYTPKSIWVTKYDIDSGVDYCDLVARTFSNSSIMIKDYVKSRKHEWLTACYIPNASDKEHVRSIVENFIRLQGADLNEGIVFREFVQLNYLTNHSISNMPLPKEYRLFFKNGKLMTVFNYWDEGTYGTFNADIAVFQTIGQQIESNFFTMDIAQKKDGSWTIIELGDGQVSGLPENASINEFYKSLISTD